MSYSNDIPLGKEVSYPKSFSPDVLFAIPRQTGREHLGMGDSLPFVGYDLWTCFETYWLQQNGLPATGVMEIKIPANSVNIVESKSLKLFVNSLFYTRFSSVPEVEKAVARALEPILGVMPSVNIWTDHTYPGANIAVSIADNISETVLSSEQIANASMSIAIGTEADESGHYVLEYPLLRSLCPVTGQPDWATVLVEYQGKLADKVALHQYFYSFSEHQGFHEQCVEMIFLHLSTHIKPTKLAVGARYTRRGGIDINPFRTSHEGWGALQGRQVKQ